MDLFQRASLLAQSGRTGLEERGKLERLFVDRWRGFSGAQRRLALRFPRR
jgi:hypothetical protein